MVHRLLVIIVSLCLQIFKSNNFSSMGKHNSYSEIASTDSSCDQNSMSAVHLFVGDIHSIPHIHPHQ
jgi:hypothetical protein